MSCPTDPVAPSAPATFGNPSLPQQPTTTVLTSTNPQKVSLTDVYFEKATFFGYKAFAANVPTNNSGTVYLGWKITDQPRPLAVGQSLVIEAPAGQRFNLAQLYLRGAANDGVVVEYS